MSGTAARVIEGLFLVAIVGLILTKEGDNRGFSTAIAGFGSAYANVVRGIGA